MSAIYPVALNLAGRRCVIVGGGCVATRKARDLLASGAEVIVISPSLSAELTADVQRAALTWRAEAYRVGVLADLHPMLVFAATDSPAVNRAITDECHGLHIWVNGADSATAGDFATMAALRQPPITLAISTGGTSPALAAYLKQRLADVIGAEYAVLAQWLGDLRPTIEAHLTDQQQRRALYWSILHSDALAYLQQGDQPAARREVDRILAEVLA